MKFLVNTFDIMGPIIWLPIGIAALIIWRRSLDDGAGYYALGIFSHGLAMLMFVAAVYAGNPNSLHYMRFLLDGLYPIGLALAALTWAPATPRPIRLSLTIVTAAAVISQYFYVFTAHIYRPGQQDAGLLFLIQTLFWAALITAAWTGFRQEERRPLLWLAALALCLGADSALTTLSLFGSPPLGRLTPPIFNVLTLLSFVTAIGVLWSAAKPAPRPPTP